MDDASGIVMIKKKNCLEKRKLDTIFFYGLFNRPWESSEIHVLVPKMHSQKVTQKAILLTYITVCHYEIQNP